MRVSPAARSCADGPFTRARTHFSARRRTGPLLTSGPSHRLARSAARVDRGSAAYTSMFGMRVVT
jgi:hypothetical protein